MGRLLLFITLLCCTSFSFGQQSAVDGPKLIYDNQFYAGGQLNTAGWGIQGYHGKYDGYYKVKTKGIEIVKIKHPKEFKLIGGGRENTRRYAYGKLNSFQSIRLLLGRKKLISDKLRQGAVTIGCSWSIGPSFGFLVPIYVEVIPDTGTTTVVERYDPDIHPLDRIRGRANFLNGIAELKPVIGGVVKASLLFEYSGVNDGIQQLEVGISADVFSGEVPIMVEEANNQMIFPAIFLSYSLGKKYVRR
ncbi:MAG: hypothetical protein AB8B53_11720 [Flavobacteriales bacterium]